MKNTTFEASTIEIGYACNNYVSIDYRECPVFIRYSIALCNACVLYILNIFCKMNLDPNPEEVFLMEFH